MVIRPGCTAVRPYKYSAPYVPMNPFKKIFSGFTGNIKDILPEVEERLLAADVSPSLSAELIRVVELEAPSNEAQAITILKHHISDLLSRGARPCAPTLLLGAASSAPTSSKPSVFIFVGINGAGKTTTIGKLSYLFKKQNLKTLLVAGDTFRAAANDQLKIWADRTGADFVGGQPDSDPASVVFDGVSAGKNRQVDVVLVDTSGRLQTKTHLMEELKKMGRICEKALGRKPDGIFLVLDSTIGQNSLSQAKLFSEIIPVTGFILTKYDGTSKGGVLLSIIKETGLPVLYVGVGEKMEDLKPFNAIEFIEGLFN